MLERNKRRKNRIILPASLLLSVLILCACGKAETVAELPTATEPPVQPSPTARIDTSTDGDKIRISELMSKNRTCLTDEDGSFSDWIELENYSDEELDLSGWTISDKEDEDGWRFPATRLAPGQRLIVYADGKDRESGMHTDFSLSQGESVYLYNADGQKVSAVPCLSDEADTSVSLNENGVYEQSIYPTPGYPNSYKYFQQWQCSRLVSGPLQINRAVVDNQTNEIYGADWVEIKNISDEAVMLSD